MNLVNSNFMKVIVTQKKMNSPTPLSEETFNKEVASFVISSPKESDTVSVSRSMHINGIPMQTLSKNYSSNSVS